MNKKYWITETGEEVELGDRVSLTTEKKTSFGIAKIYEEFTLTAANIDSLIKNGIIKCIENKKNLKDIGYYINKIANRIHCSSEELINWLEKLNKAYPKAVLDVLLQAIAIDYYNKDPEAFNKSKEYYSLKPKDGTVGRVLIKSYIPLFKSIEDAEDAREILKDQLKLMYGEQKDN